jgi:hypothetical protein
MQDWESINTKISYEPIETFKDDGVSTQDKDKIEKIYDQMANPKANLDKAEKNLLALREKYPNVAMIENFLIAVYGISGKRNKCITTIKEHYKKYPNYLFAKVAYAREIMHDEKDWFEQVFGQALCLEDLYPDRDIFHISEVIAFFALMIENLINKESFSSAEVIFDMLDELDHGSDNIIESLRPKMAMIKFMNTIQQWKERDKQKKNKIEKHKLPKKLRDKYQKQLKLDN